MDKRVYSYAEIKETIMNSYNNGYITSDLIEFVMNGKNDQDINDVIPVIYKRIKHMFDNREDRFDCCDVESNNECIMVNLDHNKDINQMIYCALFKLE